VLCAERVEKRSGVQYMVVCCERGETEQWGNKGLCGETE